ncbi:hypothetical protein WA026_009273 [Henosepilachna vigintioctopunctata]|uniref:Uncharacterized protein n=1 Tax=Henosepilachna vigintioctopunctata TaxID=420089 RepID=A0AAW1UYK5_9CUCU
MGTCHPRDQVCKHDGIRKEMDAGNVQRSFRAFPARNLFGHGDSDVDSILSNCEVCISIVPGFYEQT